MDLIYGEETNNKQQTNAKESNKNRGPQTMTQHNNI
jgi:hypothetical protein